MLRCRRVEDVPGRMIADFLRQQAPAASPTSDPAPDALPSANPPQLQTLRRQRCVTMGERSMAGD